MRSVSGNGTFGHFGRRCLTGIRLALGAILLHGCSLFETREPEPPGQSGFDFVPATVPSIVISNLQSAVAQKNIDNYMRNFSDPALIAVGFEFIPSTEASTVYPNIQQWTYDDERAYFQNLVAKANGVSQLTLTAKDSLISATNATYSFDYILSFQHTDAATFPTVAQGNLQFDLAPDAGNIWTIYRWIDFNTTPEITWSSFKGKFGN
jgi:hypothetical protein